MLNKRKPTQTVFEGGGANLRLRRCEMRILLLTRRKTVVLAGWLVAGIDAH